MPRPAVFLDRDDTVCRNADLPDAAWAGRTPGDLLDPAHVHALPGVADALARLRRHGFAIVIITNQGGVARAGGTPADIDACHDALRNQLPLTHGSTLLPPVAHCPLPIAHCPPAPHPPPPSLLIPAPIANSLIDAFYSAPHHPDGTDPRFATEHPWRKPGGGMILAAAEELGLDLSQSWMVGDKQRDLDAAVGAGIDPARTIRIFGDPTGQADAPGSVADLPAAADRILEAVKPLHPVRAERVTLRAINPDHHPLDDPRTRETVAAAARGLAERSGVRLLDLSLTRDSVTATLATHRLAAVAFMNELRRHTNHWHTQSRGGPLWAE